MAAAQCAHTRRTMFLPWPGRQSIVAGPTSVCRQAKRLLNRRVCRDPGHCVYRHDVFECSASSRFLSASAETWADRIPVRPGFC
jgi:hypothetical protein